jgi:lipid A 3-O-deacylase
VRERSGRDWASFCWVVALWVCLSAAPAAAAEETPVRIEDEAGTFTFTLENDVVGDTDRFYTNGFQFTWRAPSTNPPRWITSIGRTVSPLLSNQSAWRWGLAFGQSIFTPEDTARENPDPNDRPYAGWLYGDFTITASTRNSYGSLELQAGVVGPSALGEQVQNTTHDILGVAKAQGWDYQLEDEPGVNLIFSRLWRYNALLDPETPRGLAVGIVPSVNASLGNVQTYADIGMMVRIGRNLYADFGPPRIRPAIAGSAYVQPDGYWGGYLFAGVTGRAVAYNIFLDGNTFKESRSVDKNVLVGDASLGGALLLPWGRLSYVHTFRTEEFVGQDGLVQYGSISLSLRF